MSELFDMQRVAELGNAILHWLAANVFVLDNAAQLAALGLIGADVVPQNLTATLA